MDLDINTSTRTELKHMCQALRDAIRKHRDAKGHNLCWENNVELYNVLPERPEIDPEIPGWKEFMQACAAYRASLDTHPSQNK